MKSYSKYLATTYGGKWKYDRKACVWSDGKREVRRVCSVHDDEDSRFPPTYVMYEVGGGFLAYVSCPDADLRRYYPLSGEKHDRH